MKFEGYWYSISAPEYPMPVSQINPISDAVLSKFDMVCAQARVKKYKGHSPCRLCDKEKNGCSEYRITIGDTEWAVPYGFRHYLVEHNVHLSPEFEKAILGEYLKMS